MFKRFSSSSLVISQEDIEKLKKEFKELKEENAHLKDQAQYLRSNAAWKLVDEYQVEITDLKLKYNEVTSQVNSLNKTLIIERESAKLVLNKLREVISMFEEASLRSSIKKSLEQVNIYDIIG